MAVEKKRKGFGQVEPNHLSARYTGQIYAQLPAKHSSNGVAGNAIEQLENGQFLKYDYAAGCASDDGDAAGEWMLVFNEEKLYDERYPNHRYFAMKKDDFTDKLIYPRLLKTNVGDIFTTNTFKSTDATPKTVTTGDEVINLPAGLTIGATVVVGDDGWLELGTPSAGDIAFKVVPHFTQIGTSGVDYTLGDMQFAVKLQRVQ